MRRYLVFSFVALATLLLILSCAKPKRTNPYDPSNPTAPGTLLGRVTDTEGFPVNGAKVSTSPTTSDAFSDSLGYYQTPSLPPKAYQVIVSAASHDTAYYNVTINPTKSETLNPQMVYNGPGEITGTVTEVGTNRVVKQGFVYTRPDSQLHHGQTDGTGHYRLTDVPSGTYYVVAYKDQYYSKESLQVVIPPKRVLKYIQLQPLNRGWIFGQVASSDSSGVNGAVLQTLPATDTVTSGAGGYYWFRQLFPGTYVIRVSSAPKPPPPDSSYFWTQTDTVVVTANDTAVASFLLNRAVWWNYDNDPLRSPAVGWVVRRGVWMVTDTLPPTRCYLGVDTSTVGAGAVTLPADSRHLFDDFSLSADIFIPGYSPPRGRTEVLFRWQDDLHHYRVSIADSQGPGEVALFKVMGGVPTRLDTRQIGPFGRDQWHGVRVVFSLPNLIEVWVDGVRRIQVTDGGPIQPGRIGLGLSARGIALFDNVIVFH